MHFKLLKYKYWIWLAYYSLICLTVFEFEEPIVVNIPTPIWQPSLSLHWRQTSRHFLQQSASRVHDYVSETTTNRINHYFRVCKYVIKFWGNYQMNRCLKICRTNHIARVCHSPPGPQARPITFVFVSVLVRNLNGEEAVIKLI